MKRLVGIGVFILLLSIIGSCKKIRKLKEFDLMYTEDIIIPANNTVLTVPFDIVTPEQTTNTEAEYDNQGTSSKLVEEVKLTKLLFSIKSPTSSNFDFLNSVEIFLSSPNNTEILVASKYNIPETGLKQLEMEVSSENLKNILQDESYNLRVKTVTDKTIFSDITVTTNATFHVKARVKNVFKRK
ncbi:hypothetical protein [Sediminibacterium sp.]|uniref:hypothetical protein n=1 Tax=Sediminibacterium sp. TaxID=1917865 RepID=UPI0027343121|nr:hypothetical protein [Sediminibacterium sp.]MDP3567471.1 hypothetical protein [Sediminibacterium sp.]